MNKEKKNYKNFYILIIIFIILFIFLNGCSILKFKSDISYIFKTDPEKAAIDFLKALNDKNPDYIYDNLLPLKDKSNISKEKFKEELNLILSDVNSIEIEQTTYSGYIDKDNIVKVIVQFNVKYKNGQVKQYKKYFYLLEENKEWKIIFEKTFI